LAKKRSLPALSDVQLEIMNLVWEKRECSVADVWDVLRQRRGVARNTVHTLMVRLKEKGWLTQRSHERGVVYRASVSRDETQRAMIEKMRESLFEGSASGLVLALLGGQRLSSEEADRIQRMIDQARRKTS
jgi:predicted transcriptional regulator